ncbi:MAG: LacI family DNA-binding transcriptional regulator [Verrucomicrobiota bacterium]
MNIRLKEIARELDVSVSTVSRSLSNHPSISSATQARVMRLAAQKGYYASRSIHSRKNSKNNKLLTLGVLIQDDENKVAQRPVQDRLLIGMSEAAEVIGTCLSICYVPLRNLERISEPAFQPMGLRENLFAGLILIHQYPEAFICRLSERLPCVVMNNHTPGLPADYVGVDNSHAIGEIFNHLFNLGHRRIGFVGDEWNSSWLHVRFSGYIQSLCRYGLPYEPEIVEWDVGRSEEKASALAQRMAAKTRLGTTAWICENSVVGYDMVRRLTALGLCIPQDVSLTGFEIVSRPDDYPGGPADCPQLTSLRAPFEELGAVAVQRLTERIRRPFAPICRMLLQCELIKGQTTAKPPAQ